MNETEEKEEASRSLVSLSINPLLCAETEKEIRCRSCSHGAPSPWRQGEWCGK